MKTLQHIVMVAFVVGFFMTITDTTIAGGPERKRARIVVWDERQPKQKEMYRNFLGNHIARYLRKEEGLFARSVGLDDREQG